MKANDIRAGWVIDFEGRSYRVLSSEHRSPGNKRAFIQVKMANIVDGTQREHKFGSTEEVEKLNVFQHTMQFLYNDGAIYHFMNTANYEQSELPADLLGNAVYYMQPEATVEVEYCEEKPVGVRLPPSMEFEIIETEPGIKNATATTSFKQAKISTGHTIKVPQFIEVGDRIKVNPAEDKYLERAKA